MTWHLYLVPIIGDGSESNKRRPKYLSELGVNGPKPKLHYGSQPDCIVAADLTDPQETTLLGNADVTKIPDNLDSTVTAGTLNATQNAFESRFIPGNWITVGTPYRNLVRIGIGAFALLKKFRYLEKALNPLMTGAVNLNTTFGSLPAAVRTGLLNAANALELDTSGFTGASTLRQILKGVGDQLQDKSYELGGITI